MELSEKLGTLSELFPRSRGLPGENLLLGGVQPVQGDSGTAEETVEVARGLQLGEE